MLFFNCKSNPYRHLSALRRLREDFQKTSVEIFSRKSSTKIQISDELRSNLKLTCLSEKKFKTNVRKSSLRISKFFVYKGKLEDF